MDDLDALARLAVRIETLEHRVSVLEHPSAVPQPAPAKAANPAALPIAVTESPLTQDDGTFAVLGKAMLGIAGAYLLRAVAESGSFSKLIVIILALAYAGMWLVWAARCLAERRLASTVYATTAALILAPMLWELTLRFEFLPTYAAAGILAAFVVAADALGWKHNLSPIIWVANVTALVTCFALLIATHDLVPFVVTLLFIALVGEAAACRNRGLALRMVLATAADVATWIFLYIYSRPEGIPGDYKSVAPAAWIMLGCIPLLIYGASTAFRTIRLHEKIRLFEIGQNIVAFLLAAFSIQRLGSDAGATVLGAACLFWSALGYVIAFLIFDGSPERFAGVRNYHVYATWSLALLLAGTFLCLPPLLLALSLSLAALGATFAGVRKSRLTLEFHGLACLAAAAYASGLLGYAGSALAGTFPAAPGWIVWIVAAAAIVCYALGGRSRAEKWNDHVLQSLSAILAAAAAITFLVSVLVWLAAIGMNPGPSNIAVIRTLITCLVALALAFGGSRFGRIELVWIAYGALALVTAKLLFEDLQHGHPASTAVSIFLYAATLILVPRMARIGGRT